MKESPKQEKKTLNLTEEQLKKKLTEYGNRLKTISEQRNTLSAQLQQVTDEGKQLVGAIRSLQDLLKDA